MPVYILYFLAAGAATIGGPAIGAALYKRGQQDEAAYSREHDIKAISRLLRSEMGLAQLRHGAECAGIDPDAVERGYYELRSKHPTVGEIATQLAQWNER